MFTDKSLARLNRLKTAVAIIREAHDLSLPRQVGSQAVWARTLQTALGMLTDEQRRCFWAVEGEQLKQDIQDILDEEQQRGLPNQTPV